MGKNNNEPQEQRFATLKDVASEIKKKGKKPVQLIYAFNGVGKTRLSRAFQAEVEGQKRRVRDDGENESLSSRLLYYNAFTEDLFYWDNAREEGQEHVLRIRENSFTDWILREQGKEDDIIKYFQHYTSDKLIPRFDSDYRSVLFSVKGGNNDSIQGIKVSKGEESCFIWSIFFRLLQQIMEDYQGTQYKYIFIDDPVTSLDENHLVELAVDIARVINEERSKESVTGVECKFKYIITTHNPLFFNVLVNELGNSHNGPQKLLRRLEDGTYQLVSTSDHPFSYHLYLLDEISRALKEKNVRKHHFAYLRHILEKTSVFLGYSRWGDLLPQDLDLRNSYYGRLLNLSSHSSSAHEEIALVTDKDLEAMQKFLKYLESDLKFSLQTLPSNKGSADTQNRD